MGERPTREELEELRELSHGASDGMVRELFAEIDALTEELSRCYMAIPAIAAERDEARGLVRDFASHNEEVFEGTKETIARWDAGAERSRDG